jgi:peroxiredoxin
VDSPAAAKVVMDTHGVWFPLLSDPGLGIHGLFNVINQLDDAGFERLKGFGLDVEAWSGRTHHAIAIPSIFFVDEDRTIIWAHAAHDYKTRPSVEQIIEVMETLSRHRL